MRKIRIIEHGQAGMFMMAVACSVAVPVVLIISPLRTVAAPQSTSAPGQARPGFEVASVRLNTSGSDKAYLQATPGRLEITNVALRRLILSAYGGQDYQISGDPPWASSDHYDIQARSEGNAPVQQMEGPMLQVLLEDRFRLKVHHEIRQLPVYELTVAKSGLKMEHSKEGSCVPYSVDSPPPPVAPGAPHPVFCGFPKLGIDGLNRTLDGVGVSMEVLAGDLSRSYASALNRTVLDKTGLTGTFDLHLKWAIEASAPDSGDTTSIFTALQEQLGLKLESAKGPVEVLVLDHVEKPSEN